MRYFRLIVLSLALLPAMLFAKATLEVTLDKNRISPNETLLMTFRISDNEASSSHPSFSAPRTPGSFDFEIIGRGGPAYQSQSSFSNINGVVNAQNLIITTYQMRLRPKKSGKLLIPAMSVGYDGGTLESQELVVEVGGSSQPLPPSSQILFQQTLSSEEAVVGVPVTLEVTITAPSSTVYRDFQLIPQFELMKDNLKIEESGEKNEFSSSSAVENGVRIQRYRKSYRLTPERPGSFRIPQMFLQANRASSKQRSERDPFNDPFFGSFFGGREKMETDTIASNELTLNVQDFPEEGKPQGFTGLVGPLTATASIDMDEVYVGDPITLTITLKNASIPGNDAVPDIRKLLPNGGLFKVAGDDPVVTSEDGTATFKRTIRPLSTAAKEIPSFKIPYFDPTTKSYGFATTNPLPITVNETKTVTLNGTDMPTAIAMPTQENGRDAKLSESSGLFLDALDGNAGKKEWSPLHDGGGRKGLIWFVILPGLLWTATASWVLLRRRAASLLLSASSSRRLKNTLAKKLKRINGASNDASRQVADAFCKYLSARTGIRGGAPTYPETFKALADEGIDEKNILPLKKILSMCEAAQYAGASLPAEEFIREINDVVKEL